AYLTAVGLFLLLGCLIHSLVKGKKAPANPWGGTTLEWQCTSPPPMHNFDQAPEVGDPYDHSKMQYDEDTSSYHSA
ncbi:MAG: cytochrome c oxidase subunit I, partial [Phycisphaerales bacterium JB038]